MAGRYILEFFVRMQDLFISPILHFSSCRVPKKKMMNDRSLCRRCARTRCRTCPATALDIEPEPDEFVVPAEAMTRDEIRFLPRAVEMPPLRPEEMPDTEGTVLPAGPNRTLDDPSWGAGAKSPEITLRKGKLLHPWDSEPEETP